MTGRQVFLTGVVATALLGLPGCYVNARHNSDGKDKDVSIHTPFGGLQVHTDDVGAAALGLPAYPGAASVREKDGGDKGVDMALGFAQWQLHVQVANYVTSDPQPKVQEFYRKALARYGVVLVCHGNRAVSSPDRTAEGLTCGDHNGGKSVHVTDDSTVELMAGSEQHQHIVAFNHRDDPGTHFSLVALRLPTKDSDGNGDKAE